jgi:hypothetical protein
MGDTEQPEAGMGMTRTEAAAELADIKLRQQKVIESVLVPVWYWWVMAAGMIAIGAARDSHDRLVQAITIPLAVLVMVVLTGAMIPEVRRRIQVHSASQPGARGAAAIFGLIVLVNVATVATAVSLDGHGIAHPLTIGYGAGAVVLVIAGPLVMGYCHRLMLTRARQQMTDAPDGGAL